LFPSRKEKGTDLGKGGVSQKVTRQQGRRVCSGKESERKKRARPKKNEIMGKGNPSSGSWASIQKDDRRPHGEGKHFLGKKRTHLVWGPKKGGPRGKRRPASWGKEADKKQWFYSRGLSGGQLKNPSFDRSKDVGEGPFFSWQGRDSTSSRGGKEKARGKAGKPGAVVPTSPWGEKQRFPAIPKGKLLRRRPLEKRKGRFSERDSLGGRGGEKKKPCSSIVNTKRGRGGNCAQTGGGEKRLL